jgi:hypothetical protein
MTNMEKKDSRKEEEAVVEGSMTQTVSRTCKHAAAMIPTASELC